MITFTRVDNPGNEKFRNEMTIALAEKESQFQQQVKTMLKFLMWDGGSGSCNIIKPFYMIEI